MIIPLFGTSSRSIGHILIRALDFAGPLQASRTAFGLWRAASSLDTGFWGLYRAQRGYAKVYQEPCGNRIGLRVSLRLNQMSGYFSMLATRS